MSNFRKGFDTTLGVISAVLVYGLVSMVVEKFLGDNDVDKEPENNEEE